MYTLPFNIYGAKYIPGEKVSEMLRSKLSSLKEMLKIRRFKGRVYDVIMKRNLNGIVKPIVTKSIKIKVKIPSRKSLKCLNMCYDYGYDYVVCSRICGN